MFDVFEYQADLVRFWIGLYRKEFGITLKEALIPEPQASFEGKILIISVPSLGAQRLVDQFRRSYDIFVWTERDLNKVLDQSDSVRSAADGPYGIWVEAGEEPDEDLMGKSGAELKHLGLKLEERLLLGHFHWLRTSRHLDMAYRTICSGSTYDNGGFPCVGWVPRHKQVIVDCCFLPNQVHSQLCVRKVIAAPEIASVGVTYQ